MPSDEDIGARLENWGSCVRRGTVRHRAMSAEGRYFNPTAGHWWERPVTPITRTLDHIDAQVVESGVVCLDPLARLTLTLHYIGKHPVWFIRKALLHCPVHAKVREVEYHGWLESCHAVLQVALDRITPLQKSNILRERVRLTLQ